MRIKLPWQVNAFFQHKVRDPIRRRITNVKSHCRFLREVGPREYINARLCNWVAMRQMADTQEELYLMGRERIAKRQSFRDDLERQGYKFTMVRTRDGAGQERVRWKLIEP